MEKKEKLKLVMVYVFVFLIAVFIDMRSGVLEKEAILYREELDGEAVDVELLLNVEDVMEDYALDLEIEPMQVTKEEAEDFFRRAESRIEADFQTIDRVVPMQKTYENGLVEAEWTFSPAGVIGSAGEIDIAEVPAVGMLVVAQVSLSCGAYEKILTFPFRLEKPALSEQEKILEALSSWFEKEQQKEGTKVFALPEEIEGYSLRWSEKKESVSLKIALLEGLSIILLIFARKKEEEAKRSKRCQQRESLYPEILNQLLILLEAGMTTRQAWHRISVQYKEKRKRSLIEECEVYEAIVLMDRRLMEGEKEKLAYESFCGQMEVVCYRRLTRLLVNSLEKGSKDICQQLNLEAKQAYDQRLLLAKKLGEEASTKMLFPMMLMMVLVMVIIMAPAMMSFGL